MLDLVQQQQQLLAQQVSFVAVRIFSVENSENIRLGTCLLTTQDNFFSLMENKKAEALLLDIARNLLKQQVSKTLTLEIDGIKISAFLEVFKKAATLLIIGAGHIAVPLYQIAKIQGFRVVILDDRADYANYQRFPDADEIMVGSFVETLRNINIDENTYVALLTRGHVYDKDCLGVLLGKQAAYLGMIGSLRRLAGVFRLMQQLGYKKEDLAQVHAPIGLPIGGDTPEEIALGIMAEITSVRYRGKEWSLQFKKEFHSL